MDRAHPANVKNPAPAARSELGAGEVVGKYRVVRDVGIGGMAQVLLAHRQGPEGFAKPYVIKRILPQYARDEQFAKMFVVEAKVAALLDHPNIVHVFDFDIESGDYYLVMEYVAGASLAQIMRANRRRGTPLGQHIAVEVGAAMAHALAYAHELCLPDGRPLELVHRDISPGNVILSRDGAVKLADFGVVKTSMTATVFGTVNGKWAYMSPEQISGQVVDKRSDLFSLGIVLYEIVTGQRLFRAENPAATASRVMNMPIRRPSSIVPEVHSGFEQIIMTMLERDPQRRYQSATALAAALEAVRALPQFSAGSARLRTLVRSLFPEESFEPALGAFFTDAPRETPATAQFSVPVDTGPVTGTPPAAPSVPVSTGRLIPKPADTVTMKLIVGVTALCAVASLLFWLAVF